MEDLHAESFGMAVRIVRSRRKSVDDGRRSVRQWTTTKLKGATKSLLPPSDQADVRDQAPSHRLTCADLKSGLTSHARPPAFGPGDTVGLGFALL